MAPTPEQFEEWAAIADGILAGRDMSALSEAEKASVSAIRAMGPDAAKAWINQNIAFASPAAQSNTVLGPDGTAVSIDDLPPNQRDYYTRIKQQQAQDRLDETAIFSRLTTSSSSSNSAPPRPDTEPSAPTLPIAGSLILGSSGGISFTGKPSAGFANAINDVNHNLAGITEANGRFASDQQMLNWVTGQLLLAGYDISGNFVGGPADGAAARAILEKYGGGGVAGTANGPDLTTAATSSANVAAPLAPTVNLAPVDSPHVSMTTGFSSSSDAATPSSSTVTGPPQLAPSTPPSNKSGAVLYVVLFALVVAAVAVAAGWITIPRPSR